MKQSGRHGFIGKKITIFDLLFPVKKMTAENPEFGQKDYRLSPAGRGNPKFPSSCGSRPNPLITWLSETWGTYVGNFRKISLCLAVAESDDLIRAWHLARADHRPLNQMITFTLAEINDLAPADRCMAWKGIRNQVSIRLTRHKIEPTFVWTREMGPEGEHMHVLAHVPRGLGRAVADSFGVWKPAPAIDVRSWSQTTWRAKTKGGKVRGGIGYLLKNQSQEASDRNGFDRVTGGAPIYGRRYGMTRNLLRKPIRAAPSLTQE